MSRYLTKYVGTYRVKADYDMSTNDFPRLEDGTIDPEFDDMYIDCKNNIEIRHSARNILFCLIPSKSRGMNVLRQIYTDNSSNKLPEEKGKYCENLCANLEKEKILVDAEVLDFEAYFYFKSSMLDYIAKLVGAKTNGKSISPFSVKNLPKELYKIPENDLNLYREAIKNLPTREMNIKGKIKSVVDGLVIKQLNKEFDDVIKKSQSKKFDVDKDRKQKCLKGKEYIHSMGLWEEYCDFLESKGK